MNGEIKRKIDHLRDLLVGRIPMPTEQVKQITLGLIYKFMSDIDEQNRELGGGSFFSGNYQQYAWKHILDHSLSAYERVILYSEGLEKMSLNPNIPQLFRDIFKGAFLPFRDPAIVDQFLKGLNEFEYQHSEDLGDAYEYLLSIMGSQGDAGQFRTPRHIIDFIVAAVEPQKEDRVLDPACGTAGFLVSAYKYILKGNTLPGSDRPGSALQGDERRKITENFVGYDISQDMMRISLVNMYLHQFTDPQIYEYDTLTSLDRWNDTFDCILTNPPFMSPSGGIRPHNRFGVHSTRSEVLFVDYIMEHLSPGGKAGVIVPEGIIFQSGNAYKLLRKKLVEEGYLYAVISLPAGVFNPYSNVKTSILLMDRRIAQKAKGILFVKVEADGFDLGAQRKPIEKNDLPNELEIIWKYKSSIISNLNFELNDDNKLMRPIIKEEISKTGDYNLTAGRYLNDDIIIKQKWPMVELGNVCEIYQPKTITSKDINSKGLYKVFGANGVIGFYDKYNHEESEIIVTCRGATCGTMNISEPKSWITGNAMVIHPNNESVLIKKFLYYFLDNSDLRMTITGTAQPQITRQSISPFKMPLPPLEVQREIVTEIEEYQKIIDGARQVVENWKPRIKIDPEWEILPFKEAPIEIIDGDRGKNYPKKSDFSKTGFCLFLNTSNVREDGFNFDELEFVNKERDELLGKGRLERNDLVLTTRGTVGNVGLFDLSVEFPVIRINSGMVVIRPEIKILHPKYLFLLIQCQYIQSQIKNLISGSAQPQLPIRVLNNITLPIPSMEKQIELINEFEEQQKGVDACKKLIEINQRKIKEKFSEVWGEV